MVLQNYVTIHARLVYADLLVDRQLSNDEGSIETTRCVTHGDLLRVKNQRTNGPVNDHLISGPRIATQYMYTQPK